MFNLIGRVKEEFSSFLCKFISIGSNIRVKKLELSVKRAYFYYFKLTVVEFFACKYEINMFMCNNAKQNNNAPMIKGHFQLNYFHDVTHISYIYYIGENNFNIMKRRKGI